MRLDRKRIHMTGKARVIGSAITRVCLAEGADVFAIGQDGGARS